MSLIQWNDAYSVNNKRIDDQHKRFFLLINMLDETLKGGKEKDVLGKAVNELADYTIYHFNTEERLFLQYGYPGSALHKNEHAKMKQKAVELRTAYESGEMGMTAELMTLLKDWLSRHILDSDKKFGEFLNSKGDF